MKFTDGYWQIKEGVNISSPAELRDIKAEDTSLTVYAYCKAIQHRGDTLNGALLTFDFSSPIPDVICVKVSHHNGKIKKGPEFNLHSDDNLKVKIQDDDTVVSIQSGFLSARVHKTNGWAVDYYYKDRRISGNGSKNTGYITTNDRKAYMREQLDLDVGECVYGLGERFTAFVKNGQSVDMWNEDGGTSSELSYKNIPFYITNRGYGVFVNHPECVSFEIASETVSKAQFSVPGEVLEYYIIGGESIKAVLQNYTTLTGKPALPPAWSFGLWLTTSFTTSYDEKTVNSFIDGMLQRDLPLRVFHFDCFWMKEFQWCDFVWDKDVFPEPENMLKQLKSKGLKICVWINPYIAQKSYLFNEGMENGYLLKNLEGDVWQWDMWQAGMGLVDFTNPDAVSWFKGKLKKLIDMGVDCFKTDFGERIPTDVSYFDGSDQRKMHNFYTYLYNKAVYEVLTDSLGRGEAMLFARSATAGSQKFPVHWGGDCTASYTSMAETLRGGLSLSLSGFGFWSHDISGFEKTASPDIYKRWVAFGLLSSHSRLHGSDSYRVPWLFDEESVDVLRFFTKLKCSLMPYLFKTACEASGVGIPMMRAMILEFSDDPACDSLDRQYMLGGSLLVAPVFNIEGIVDYYLPEGRWTNLITGEEFQGGCWRKEHHGYMSIPLMVRPNSIIAVGSEDSKPDYDYADGLTLHVFGLEDGGEAASSVCNTSGDIELKVAVKRLGKMVLIYSEGVGKPWSLIMRGEKEIQSIENASWEPDNLGIRILPAKCAAMIRFYLK